MGTAAVDLVVVGAGPAGCAAAIAAARAGRRVLLLDRAAFPRDKPCGDLIGARAMAAARRLGIGETALAPYSPLAGAFLTAGDGALDLTPKGRLGRSVLARTDARVIPRRVFDAALVAAAIGAGAEVRQATVRAVGPWRDGVRSVTGSSPAGAVEIAARAVVLAGGYGCRVADDAAPDGRDDHPPKGIAMRGYFEGVASPAGRIVFCLDEWLLPGYGWLFPLPEGRANAGVGTLVREGEGRERLRDLYDRFVGDPASPAAPWLGGASAEDAPRSWPLDLGPRRRRLVADGLAVAGEAAGLVGPLTGAGIAFALASGEAAGEAIARALDDGDVRAEALRPYARGLRRRFGPWLRAEAAAQRWLGDPAHVGALLRTVRPLPPTGTIGARLLLHLG